MEWRGQVIGLGTVLGLVMAVIPSDGQVQVMPCTEEIRTYCPDVQPGGGRILKCLQDNESKLSSACMQRMHDFQEAVSGPMAACRDDWVAYCYHPWASTDRQAMMQCLQAHQTKLSSGCQKALQGAGDPKRQRTRGMP